MTALLSLESVSKSYWRGQSEVKVFRNLSLEVASGQFVAVCGKPSAGKTTLLKIAAGLVPPDSGSVRFGGRNLTDAITGPPTVYGRDIGWVARREPSRPTLPVKLHIALPLYRVYGAQGAHERTRAALARLGVERCATHRWSDLADTDRALVSIAQALAHQPRLLVVDDPTYGFSINDRAHVGRLLRKIVDEDGVAILMAVADVAGTMPAHSRLAIHNRRLIGGTDVLLDGENNVFPLGRQRLP